MYIPCLAALVSATIIVTAPTTIRGLWGCTTTDRHQRWALKTRGDDGHRAQAVSIAEMLTWPVPRGHSVSETAPIQPHEAEQITITGRVRLVKQSPDDCDLHLEMSEHPTTGPRIIAEIPPTDMATQQSAVGIFHLSNGHRSAREPGVSVRVTGFAFLDLSHQCAAHPKAGCQHGGAAVATLWEIHPVFAITEVR